MDIRFDVHMCMEIHSYYTKFPILAQSHSFSYFSPMVLEASSDSFPGASPKNVVHGAGLRLESARFFSKHWPRSIRDTLRRALLRIAIGKSILYSSASFFASAAEKEQTMNLIDDAVLRILCVRRSFGIGLGYP